MTAPKTLSRLILLASMATTGCTFIPSGGPSLYRVKTSANRGSHQGDFVYVTLDRRSVGMVNSQSLALESQRLATDLNFEDSLLSEARHQGSTEQFKGKPADTIVSGDQLNVTIFDKAGGLFASPIMPNGMTMSGAIPHDLPTQVVDSSGEITVPYAGRIQVLGKTFGEIQQDIEKKLSTQTVEPKVIVALKDRTGSDKVAVLGDVSKPSLLPVSMGGLRILDAIAAAGGSTGKEYETETYVTVNRGNRTCSSTLSEIYHNPAKNVFLQYGDSVFLRTKPRKFFSFGASGRVAATAFSDDRESLTEALANIGGPDENKANPSAVLVYRMEPTSLVKALGRKPVDPSSATCPVIYRIDFTQANSFMLARSFSLRENDIIYTPLAGSVGLQKFLSLIGTMFSPAASAGGAAASVSTAAIVH